MPELPHGFGGSQEATGKSSRPKQLRRRIIIAGVVAALAALGILTAVQLAGAGLDRPEAETTSVPSPAANSGVITPPKPTATGSAFGGIEYPSDCDVLYTPSMLEEFGELELNPAWSAVPGNATLYGTDDLELQSIMDANEHLVCYWGSPNGASGVGLTTSVVSAPLIVTTAVEERMGSLEYVCNDELGGTRCTASGEEEGSFWGESHFLRDDVWIATKYVDFASESYTENVVANLEGK